MTKLWIVAPALLMIWVPGSAQTPNRAPLTNSSLAKILAQPAVAGSCAMPQGEVLFAAIGTKSVCSASANCESGTVICYDYTNPANCQGFDRSCPGEPGHVSCDGVITWCATSCPPPPCSTGTLRQRACCSCAETGDCPSCDFCEHGFYTIDYCN